MTPTTDDKLADLLAGLEGVTPGPWFEGDKWVFVPPRSGVSTEALENIFRNEEAQANAAHVARCDPGTIRSLITRLQASEAREKALREALAQRDVALSGLLHAAMGTQWRHRKTGGEYTVLGACRIEATNVPAYLYRSNKDGTVWARPMDEFLDGRFERLSQQNPDHG